MDSERRYPSSEEIVDEYYTRCYFCQQLILHDESKQVAIDDTKDKVDVCEDCYEREGDYDVYPDPGSASF